MPNVCTNFLQVCGRKADVEAFFASADLSPEGDLGTLIYDAQLGAAPVYTHNDAFSSAEIEFDSASKGPFDALAKASESHPEVVAVMASVELANGNAEAQVLKGGDWVGQYDMPQDELEEAAGPDNEISPVIDSLMSTMNAYVSDTLEAMGLSNTAPVVAAKPEPTRVAGSRPSFSL